MKAGTPVLIAAVILATVGNMLAAPPMGGAGGGENPSTTASNPATAPSKFSNGDPLSTFFTALSLHFGVVVVQPNAVDAYVLKDFEMPAKLEDALAIARQTLEPQGYTIVQSLSQKRIVLRVVTAEEALKLELSESPVSYGADPDKIDASNPQRQVTHLFPVTHIDILANLRRTATEDQAVSADVAGGADIGVHLILTGPAQKVQQAVERLAKIDKVGASPIVARTLPLVHLNAQMTADALNEGFAQDTAPLKAVVDLRTNSIIITGPEDRVMDLMVTLIGQDAKRGPVLPRPEHPPTPATAPGSVPGPAIPLPPPLPVPQPDTTRPSADRAPGALDESGPDGHNRGSLLGVLACQEQGTFSPIVKESAFL